MYYKHKVCAIIVFTLVFIFTFFLRITFNDIASECISIVSFALAIYTICISSLIGSPLLNKLRSTQDQQIKHKTQLGVIKRYISSAMVVSIITLVLACISKLKTDNNLILSVLNKANIIQAFSSMCFSFFSLNFLFILLIFVFVISRQVDS